MSYNEDEEVEKGFKLNDDGSEEPIEEDEVGSFKFDEDPDDDPDNRYH